MPDELSLTAGCRAVDPLGFTCQPAFLSRRPKHRWHFLCPCPLLLSCHSGFHSFYLLTRLADSHQQHRVNHVAARTGRLSLSNAPDPFSEFFYRPNPRFPLAVSSETMMITMPFQSLHPIFVLPFTEQSTCTTVIGLYTALLTFFWFYSSSSNVDRNMLYNNYKTILSEVMVINVEPGAKVTDWLTMLTLRHMESAF